MKLDLNIINQEKKYLNSVIKIIDDEIKNIYSYAAKVKEDITSKKKEVYFMPLTDSPEITDLTHDINLKVDSVNKKLDYIYKLEKAKNNPYFGKLKVQSDTTFDAYIGICNVEKDYKYYVYDWRSPIASLYYNYGVGKAKYYVDNKEISCNLLEKYQFAIRKGELLRCFKSDIDINDEYLQEILSKSTDTKLNNIVTTIQKEQNEIIRNTDNTNLIVEGVAGSGKTVVAMHRIAFLLYQYKDLLSKDILILSPNDLFLEYISNVLPDLGEENTLGATLDGFCKNYLRVDIEKKQDFIDRVINSSYDKDIEFKLSDRKELEKFLKKYISSFNFTRKFTVFDTTIYSKEINELFNDKYKRLCFKDRINRIVDDIMIKLNIKSKVFKKKIKGYLLSKINLSTDIFEIYNLYLSKNNIKEIDKDKINYEDMINLLYIYFYINGYVHYSNIKYIVIDEAQDYSHFAIEILTKIFNSSKFILLGDPNQNINPYNKIKSLNEFSDLFNNSKFITLNKTYRSSEEIINYSNKVLGLKNISIIRRETKEDVEDKEYNIDSIKNDINILKEKYNTIAVITEDKLDAKELSEELNIPLTTSDSNIEKVSVIPSYLSKGIEYDAVIVIDNNFNNKNLYYVALTRAKSKLIVYKKNSR